jgi:hypothetical protein
MVNAKTNHSDGSVTKDPLPGRPEKIAELLHNPAFHTTLRDADIIFGCDETTGNSFLLYGKRLPERIVWTNKSESASVATVPILQATTELEALIAVVTAIKGRCHYNGGDKQCITIPITEGSLS